MCEYNYVESEDSKRYREARGKLEDTIKLLEVELKNISQKYFEVYLEKDKNQNLVIAQKDKASNFLDLVSNLIICFHEDDTFVIEYCGRNNFYTLLKYGKRLETNFKKGDSETFKIFYVISYLPELIIEISKGTFTLQYEEQIRGRFDSLLAAFVDFSKI